MDQRAMIYWAACIDSTLYLVGVFALGVWQNHPGACVFAVASKGLNYLADVFKAVEFDRGFEVFRVVSIGYGIIAGALLL